MIVYAPRALRDLQTIEAYIQQFNVTAAQRVIAAIKRTIDTLDSFPNVGTLKDEAGHRRLNVRRYRTQSSTASPAITSGTPHKSRSIRKPNFSRAPEGRSPGRSLSGWSVIFLRSPIFRRKAVLRMSSNFTACVAEAERDIVPLNLYGANLASVDLSGANLQKVDLRAVALSDAHLFRTNLRGARLDLADRARLIRRQSQSRDCRGYAALWLPK